MRKRIIATAVTIGLVLSGGAFAAAQTAETPKTETPTEKSEAESRKGSDGGQGRPHKRDDGPSPRKHDSARPDERDRGRHGPKFGAGFGHAIHGTLIVPVRPAKPSAADAAPTFETVEFDRGRVVRATDESLTLVRPDGKQITVTLNDTTRFKGVNKGSELTAGSPVFVLAKDGVARHVGQPKKP